MIADPPNSWPEVQHAFRETYETARSELERTAVHWRVIEGNVVSMRPGIVGVAVILGWVVDRVARRKPMNEQPMLAVWPTDAPAGSEATLIFEVVPSPSALEGDGVVVGALAPNGALCVETATDGVLWPTYNPRRPFRAAPRR